MATTFSEEQNKNITTQQDVADSTLEPKLLLRILEEHEQEPKDGSDALIHSNKSSHSSVEFKTEQSKRLSSHAIAFPLMMLLIIFKQMIDGTKSCNGVYKNLVEYANSFDHIFREKEPFFGNVLNTDLGSLTLENVLDKLKKSELFMETMTPTLYKHIKAVENFDVNANSNSNIIESKQVEKNRKNYKVKFDCIVYYYKYFLNTLKRLCESDYLNDVKRTKFFLRITYEDLINKSPETYCVIRKQFKKIESQIKNSEKEEKLRVINEEEQFINYVSEEIKNYGKIFEDLLFYPFGSSTIHLEDKLEAQQQKLKRLVPDFHAFSIDD